MASLYRVRFLSITKQDIFKIFQAFSGRRSCSSNNIDNDVLTKSGNEDKVGQISSEPGKENAVASIYSRDPAPFFFDRRVQKILHEITSIDCDKLLKKYIKPTEPSYEFVTDEELAEMHAKARLKASTKLQIPPILRERVPINKIWSYDPRLQQIERYRFVFTDISLGFSNRDRLIVAREVDGTLRSVSWEDRDRMNQIFFPMPLRKIKMPKMFTDELLKPMIEKQEYLYILDRATLQFEPDNPTYIQIISAVFEHVNKTKQFNLLQSTRHFGAMAFYLAFQRCLDNLLIYMIEQENIRGVIELVSLFQLLHPESKTAKTVVLNENTDPVEAIKAYIRLDGSRTSGLELAFQTYIETEKQRKQVKEDIEYAHGLTSHAT